MPTLRPSMPPANCLAVSSQRSARAGEAARAASNIRAAARPAVRRPDTAWLRSLFIMNTPTAFKRAREVSCRVCASTSIRSAPAGLGLRGGSYLTMKAAAHDVGARGRLACLIGALSVVGFRDHGLLAFAVVSIGLGVAAADRAEDPRTEFRGPGAGTGYVDDRALSGFFLTEQPGIALNAGETAALLAEADGIGACGDRDHQCQCREQRNEVPCFHDCLPD